MNKTRLAGLLSLCAFAALSTSAHQQCDFGLEGELEYNEGEITFLTQSGEIKVRIDQQNVLYLEGDRQSLDSEQQKLVSAYAAQIRETIPLVFEIIVEASEIGLQAATMALEVLFEGEDFDGLSKDLAEIREDLEQKIDATHFSTRQFEDSELEERIEATVSKAVATVMPEIAAMAIRAAFSDEGGLAGIEARADKLELLIEQKVEARADALEVRAEGLCKVMEKLDALEEKLAQHKLPEIDFIDAG